MYHLFTVKNHATATQYHAKNRRVGIFILAEIILQLATKYLIAVLYQQQ